MDTFTCEECSRELSTFHQSLEKNDMCDDCFNEATNVDDSRMEWCNCCQMFSHITWVNPYGTCQCS